MPYLGNREDVVDSSTDFAAMTPNDLDRLALRGEQLTRLLIEESANAYREVGDLGPLAWALANLAESQGILGDLGPAREHFEQSLRLSRELGLEVDIGHALHGLGELERDAGNFDRAAELLEESLAISQRIDDPRMASATTHGLGDLALEQADLETASGRYAEALVRYFEAEEPRSLAYSLGGLAAVAALRGDVNRPGTLWGALERIERERAAEIGRRERERYEARLRTRRGPRQGHGVANDLVRSRGRMKGVSERPLIRVAAQNNAEWCDAFCRTHGIVGHFRAGCWFSPVRTPRYYPDAVTLLAEITIEQVLSGIDTSEGCSVKDSFAALDLAAAGFRPLFRAHWLAREPAWSRVRPLQRWSVLTTVEQLGEWEAAWAGSAEGAGFFKPSLLKDETIGVLAGYEGERIVAGAIANRSSTVIGLSNVFDVAGDLESGWVAAAAIAASLWGEMTTVGYDSGDSLDAAHRGGFKSIGELVVWLNPQPFA